MIQPNKSNPNFHFLLVVLVLQLNLIDFIKCLRVENLKQLNKDSQSISIEWSISNDYIDKSSSSNQNQIEIENDWIGFKIKYRAGNLQYTPVLLKNTNLRKFRLDNLKSNTEYNIQVSAFNRLENEGPASNLLIVKTHEAGLTPEHTHFLITISKIMFQILQKLKKTKAPEFYF